MTTETGRESRSPLPILQYISVPSSNSSLLLVLGTQRPSNEINIPPFGIGVSQKRTGTGEPGREVFQTNRLTKIQSIGGGWLLPAWTTFARLANSLGGEEGVHVWLGTALYVLKLRDLFEAFGHHRVRISSAS